MNKEVNPTEHNWTTEDIAGVLKNIMVRLTEAEDGYKLVKEKCDIISASADYYLTDINASKAKIRAMLHEQEKD